MTMINEVSNRIKKILMNQQNPHRIPTKFEEEQEEENNHIYSPSLKPKNVNFKNVEEFTLTSRIQQSDNDQYRNKKMITEENFMEYPSEERQKNIGKHKNNERNSQYSKKLHTYNSKLNEKMKNQQQQETKANNNKSKKLDENLKQLSMQQYQIVLYENIKYQLFEQITPIFEEIDQKYTQILHIQAKIIETFHRKNKQQKTNSILQQRLEQFEKYLTQIDEKIESIQYASQSSQSKKHDRLHQTQPNHYMDKKTDQLSFSQISNEMKQMNSKIEFIKAENRKMELKIGKFQRKQESMIDFIFKQQKCDCKNLIQEILKSQEHLTMELKFVKHFQGLNSPYQIQK